MRISIKIPKGSEEKYNKLSKEGKNNLKEELEEILEDEIG
jgi:hypothetical protein